METVIQEKSIVEESKSAFCIDKSSTNIVEQSEGEWSNVPSITSDISSRNGLISKCISVQEAVDHFKSLNLSKDPLRIYTEKTKLNELIKWLKNPAKLDEDLRSEADLIVSLTQCGLDWNDSVQERILQTIYKKLTGAKLDCPQRGTHWQLVGFQGTDPSTDLRAVGLFGLLQFLHLTTDTILPLGRKLYSVANSEDQPFPLAVLSLNVTNIVLNVFNSDKLNRECNAQKSVIYTLNSFYAAVLVFMLNAWITQKKTIKDSGYLLKDAEKYCGRNVRRVLKDLPQNLKKYELP